MRRIAWLIVATMCVAALSSCCLSGFASGNQNYDINWGNIGSGNQVISPVERDPWQGDTLQQAVAGH
jgi:uncharacterized membrane protein